VDDRQEGAVAASAPRDKTLQTRPRGEGHRVGSREREERGRATGTDKSSRCEKKKGKEKEKGKGKRERKKGKGKRSRTSQLPSLVTCFEDTEGRLGEGESRVGDPRTLRHVEVHQAPLRSFAAQQGFDALVRHVGEPS
jgi:hypothetical protein